MKKTTRTKKKARNFFDLTLEERDRDVARFDNPINMDKEFRALTPKERALHERMFRDKPPVKVRVTTGKREINFPLDGDLLAQATEHARKHKISLPKMIDRGLRGYLAFVGS